MRVVCVRMRPFFSSSLRWRKQFVPGCRNGWPSLLPTNLGTKNSARNTWLHSKVEISSSLRYSIEEEGGVLKVTWSDGETSCFHSVWLRHNCQCPSCVTSSNQKAIDPIILHPNTTINKLTRSSGKGGLFYCGTFIL